MTDGTIYRGWISGNQLKIVACIAMLIDHIGMILLPDMVFLRIIGRIAFSFALLTALALAVGVCCFSGVEIDYGIMGILLPVTVRLPDFGSFGAKAALASIYTPVTVFLLFSAWLIALSLVLGGVQFFCLVAIIPIACYSGQRGKHNLKGLFYVFYPAHLALLAAIYLILNSDFLSTLF